MLQHFNNLLKDKVDIEMKQISTVAKQGLNALWNERLAALDAKYNLAQFINNANDLPETHKNVDIIDRILDVLDAIRSTEGLGDL